MQLLLSDHEVGILLHATLMNWGGPFTNNNRRRSLSLPEQEVIDGIDERFCRIRRENHEHHRMDPQPLAVSSQEAALLIAILEACIAECNGNATSIRLHLHAENEEEVRLLMDRLRALLDSQHPFA